ncbi:hypothetical protein PMI01_02893 [Caulobacter sp. AP07]|uniref:GFA family protein n=1 Tax=Caulobacter sp. AP07 TaxID=1144304 RepID=UPI000271DA0F|nr:GFA family protein [Caulobacter sp. AP07]EJL31085.1 hypothetical protein PMI01_02893 [Caulobacter sp. AP07]
MSAAEDQTARRTARCSCGGLTVTARGEPVQVNACSCLACQRMVGSAFSYTAFYSNDAVAIHGDHRSWREPREGGDGRWHERSFCPVCGSTVFVRLEYWPEMTGVSVGGFGDAAFPAPMGFYWTSSRHGWLETSGVEEHQAQ